MSFYCWGKRKVHFETPVAMQGSIYSKYHSNKGIDSSLKKLPARFVQWAELSFEINN